MATTIHMGDIVAMSVIKEPASKDAKLVVTFECASTASGSFNRYSFSLPLDKRALEMLRDDLSEELRRRVNEAAAAIRAEKPGA